MNNVYTKKEREHVERVKSQPCAVCQAHGPSDAHHIKQSKPYLCVPLCKSCHQDNRNGIHGQKIMWKIFKMDEYDALAVLIERMMTEPPR